MSKWNDLINKYNPDEDDLCDLLDEAEKIGRADRESEIIENINGYTKMLIDALDDKTENPILHEALASTRADEIRIRKLIVEQLKQKS